jgi:hypothetical protein
MVNKQFYQDFLARFMMLCAGRGLKWGKTASDVAPRKCAGSRVAPRQLLPGKTLDIRCAPSIISPALVPADFFLCPKLKTTLKGRRFQTTEEIKENSIRELRAIKESAF